MRRQAQIQTPESGKASGYKIVIKCPFCKSQNFVKWGKRTTEKRGKIQLYKCQDCNKRFSNDEGFYRMRNHEKIITMSIDMYLSNLSSRKMRNQLNRHFGTKISHISILDWVRKYVMKVQKYVNKFQPKLGGKLYADETICMRKKNQDVFWCSVDWDTRFINATLYSPQDQNFEDATQFMKNIRNSGNNISEVTTDSLGVYIPAFKKVFYSNKGKRTEQTRHTAINFSKTGKHNVRIETVFSKIKDRVYDFRGLKALWSAPILLAGIVLQHNWIEQHTTLKDYPCQRAGLRLETGQNRWLGMIKLSSLG